MHIAFSRSGHGNSAGCIGLLKAIKAFDCTRGVQFSTYAVPVILGEIKRLFRDGGAVKVSRSLKEHAMQIQQLQEQFQQKHGRTATLTELAEPLQNPSVLHSRQSR